MTSAHQQSCLQQDAALDTSLHGDSIVISGMAGLYPEANSVKELSSILYQKVDPISSSPRWDLNHPEASKYVGKVSGLDLFDAQFFMVNYRVATLMDPMSRKILEQTYHAIIDAGMNPQQLSGKKIAVYVGTSFSETEKIFNYSQISRTGLSITGCSKTMYANRISYWLNVKGPSLGIDEDSCSAIAALEQACSTIRSGDCEAAIVASANICLHPHFSIHHGRINKLSSDGKNKSFDADADGSIKSEAINVLYLQNAKNALRIYAYVKNIKSEFLSSMHEETGPRFGYYRDPKIVSQFLKTFYEEVSVPPQLVEYVEAVGSAVPEADKSELEAIEKVFCVNKKGPLLVGSVMSNIGHTEAASGISSITKVLLGYEKGILAGNSHYINPREDLQAIKEGHIRILTDNSHFNRTYAAINSMSITGINAHMLLYGHNKPKDLTKYKSNLPRLVNVSGRHEAAVQKIFNELKNQSIDAEQLALLHNIHSHNISGHLTRGFIIMDTNEYQETVSLCECIENCDETKRPLWFVYSGMGSQWPGMGTQLMRIPTFETAIQRCQRVLEPKGIDVVRIITSKAKSIFDNILHSFVGIAAIQIGLTDVLREIGIVPDKIIGHSVGELGCAYADGCLTLEEMILAAYSRGLVSIQTPLIHGSMAAVALGYQQVVDMCPPEIEVACHNGPQSSTISGPSDVMRDFVAKLSAKGIFAKEVPCSNIAYHSRYIADAGPGLLKYLSEVIKTPKLRSERWVSTSVPQENWNMPSTKYSSAEYHTNNLLGPVLFEETSALIPANAVLVEIAPHGLLQAILKRSLHSTCCNIALTKINHPDNACLVLETVGKLYNLGYCTKVEELYPKVEFPVSVGTPMLSHLIEWSHQEIWPLPLYEHTSKKSAAFCKFIISVTDKEHSFLEGHSMRGDIMYPFASGLVAVWDTLAMTLGTDKTNMSIQFRDVHLYTQPILHKQRQLRLCVSLHRGTGRFEITDDISQLMTGFVKRSYKKNVMAKENPHRCGDKKLSSDDVYGLLQWRDYSYSGEFRSIQCANESFTEANLVWNNNWVTLIDGMLQLNALRREHDGVSQPTHISYINIDLKEHTRETLRGKTLIQANIFELYDLTKCGGIVMQYLKFRDLPTVSYENNLNLNIPMIAQNKQMEIDVNNPADGKTLVLKSKYVGDIDSLYWMQVPEPDGSAVNVTVHYAGLNVADVLKATNEIPIKHNGEIIGGDYGIDFSGLTECGDRVMGMVRGGACSTHLLVQPELLWPVPAYWSLQEAATVPLAYSCAFYCLCIKAELRSGMNILVHGGAGALGQAAIAISLAHGCQVFTTVSNNEKKAFLLKLYPDLKEKHIGNSRNDSFMSMVFQATNGRGCDLIICSVKGEQKNCSLSCSTINGITLDTVQILNQENFEYGMFYMTKQRSYLVLDFMSIFEDNEKIEALHTLVSEGIAGGYVRPLTHMTYAPCEVSRAFRLVAHSQHRGRVLLQLTNTVIKTQPSLECSADSCHLIIFDQDMIGSQLANKLISRGVKKLHLHFNRSPTLLLQQKIRSWRKENIQVHVSSENLSNIKISSTISEASLSGPVEGIYVLVGDKSDCSKDIFSRFLRELDLSSRELCPMLKYFAIVSWHDDIGQDICLERMTEGFRATFIDVAILKTLHDEHYRAVYGAARCRKIMDEIERALLSPQTVLVTESREIPRPSLLQRIANITGINIPTDIQDITTLADLDVVRDHYPLICNLFRDSYNILLSNEQSALLTIKKIKQIEDSTKQVSFKEVNGLQTFFSYVDSDELLATSDLVYLPTIASTTMINDELDLSGLYLCILPGLEGNNERFRLMCERIKLPALVLQPDLNRSNESIRETAIRYTEILLQKTNLKNSFYLVGYESGIQIALEMAVILEDLGKTGKVFCIGTTPEELKWFIEEQLKGFDTEEKLQIAVTRHMLKLMGGDKTDSRIEEFLCSSMPWKSKVYACVRTLLGRVSHSTQYACAVIESAFARIQQVRRCSVTPVPLRSQIIFLRSSQTRQYNPAELQAYSQQPIVVHELSSPLAHVHNDVHCATYINQHLDPSILDAFEKSNRCVTYFPQSHIPPLSNSY